MPSNTRKQPHLYEANARILLSRVSEKYGRGLSLAGIPEEEWQILSRRGFDLVWLMGVWQRSRGAREQALLDANLRTRYDEVLPGWTDEDVAGSPYAIYAYAIDPSLGQEGDLIGLKTMLNRHGLGLVLDFVPNHVALDHPWISGHPDRFVAGRAADLAVHPGWFFTPDEGNMSVQFAHGRDPNFQPWRDTAQLNFFSSELRQALVHELLRIARVADGVRCDMAMLALNSVFERSWGAVLRDHPRPATEFWPDAIEIVKRQHPGFIFIAEAYWGLEAALQEMGFDFTYDKTFYDRLRFSSPTDICSHLGDRSIRHDRAVRFIENHDEPRALAVLGHDRSKAAATILTTVPGLRLFCDGQIEGRRMHLPVQLVREPDEATDPELVCWYDRLLEISNASIFHEGEWGLLPLTEAWEGNRSYQNLLAWSWRSPTHLVSVVVNYSAGRCQGRLKLPLDVNGNDSIALQDEIGEMTYLRDADELRGPGLYVDLGPWRAHILSVRIGHPMASA